MTVALEWLSTSFCLWMFPIFFRTFLVVPVIPAGVILWLYVGGIKNPAPPVSVMVALFTVGAFFFLDGLRRWQQTSLEW